jgi:hypothetical protein
MNQFYLILDRYFDQKLFFFWFIEIRIEIVINFCYVKFLLSIIIDAHKIIFFVIEFSTTSTSFLLDELIFNLLDEFFKILFCVVSRFCSFCEFRVNWFKLKVRMFADEKFHFSRQFVLFLIEFERKWFDRICLTSIEIFLRFDFSKIFVIQIVLLILDFFDYLEHDFHVRILSA